MPTRTVELVVVLVAPVPVGHRVEVCFLRRRVSGLFSNTLVEADHQPMITDLDSGVVSASELPWAPGDGRFGTSAARARQGWWGRKELIQDRIGPQLA